MEATDTTNRKISGPGPCCRSDQRSWQPTISRDEDLSECLRLYEVRLLMIYYLYMCPAAANAPPNLTAKPAF